MPDEIFKAARSTYRAVVSAGLMSHAALIGAAADAVTAAATAAGAPIAVLDLGCGDAAELLAALAARGGETVVASYTGVDASPPALALARKNAAASLPGVACDFVEGDLLAAAVAAPAARHGAVVASFAAHHLPSDESGKAALVRACKAALAPGGALIVVDVFLEDASTDTVPSWRARVGREVRTEWAAKAGITAEDAAAMANHLETCDLPARVADYSSWGAAAGFAGVDEVLAVPGGIGGRAIVLRV